MQKVMKAIQVLEPQKIRVIKIPIPKINPYEVLVKVRYCVTCPNWDITLYKGKDIFNRGKGFPQYPKPPGQPGHEMSGDVVAVGAKVNHVVWIQAQALQFTVITRAVNGGLKGGHC